MCDSLVCVPMKELSIFFVANKAFAGMNLAGCKKREVLYAVYSSP
jgi:hypothetical protein